MEISPSETIKLCMSREHITATDLGKRLGVTPQNVHNRIKKDNWTIADYDKYLAALGYKRTEKVEKRQAVTE